MRVIFRTDASPRIGGGHAMRCLALADALREGGARCGFAFAAMPEAMQTRVAASGHELLPVHRAAHASSETPGWDGVVLPEDLQREDAASMLASAEGAAIDWVVVDHYQLDAIFDAAVGPSGARVLVIDDLANRRHKCDLLLDQTAGRDPESYRPLVPGRCRILTGANHALLRPEFAAARSASLERRREPGKPARVLLSMGAMDAGGTTPRILEELVSDLPDIAVDVVLGAASPTLGEVRGIARRHARVTLHVDTLEVAALLTQADAAIGAAGVSAWERCCLGVPSVMLALADNQKLISGTLHRLGAAVSAGRWQDAVPALGRLLADPAALARMTAAAAAITDGRGLERTVALMSGAVTEGPALTVRPAVAADSQDLWLWRNDPDTRATAKTTAPVPWADHAGWFARALAQPETLLLVGEAGAEPLGTVRFDRLEGGDWLVSINLAAAARGRGFGRMLLAEGCRAHLTRFGPARLLADIHEGNVASQRIFAACGFGRVAEADESGFARYALATQAN